MKKDLVDLKITMDSLFILIGSLIFCLPFQLVKVQKFLIRIQHHTGRNFSEKKYSKKIFRVPKCTKSSVPMHLSLSSSFLSHSVSRLCLAQVVRPYFYRVTRTSVGWYPFSIFSQFSVFKSFADSLIVLNERWFTYVPSSHTKVPEKINWEN